VEILRNGIWEKAKFDDIVARDIFRFRTRKPEISWDEKELYLRDAYALAVWDEPYLKGRNKGKMRRVIEIGQNGAVIRARKMD
jgi:hypothetical protein